MTGPPSDRLPLTYKQGRFAMPIKAKVWRVGAAG